MKNLLYIGNNLNTAKTNTSTIQVLGQQLEAEGYNLRYASSFPNKFLRVLDMAWSCIKNAKWADAVLIDTYSTQNFYYALVCSQICRLFNVKYMPILHGGNLPNRLKNSPKFSELIFNNSEVNISPSLFLKQKFEAFGYNTIEYIPNSITIENYKVIPKKFETIRLLWLRSFSEIYNPEMAISVLKNLKDKGYKAELCMVGPDADGSLQTIKSKAKSLDVSVKFTGKLSKPEWLKLSEAYTIFINTTNFDNMPVSIIEAMALGFPIVSTNVGGMPFLIEDKTDGLLVEKNDFEAMSTAIIRIFEDTDLAQKLSKNARLKAQQFSWENVKNRWLLILNAS